MTEATIARDTGPAQPRGDNYDVVVIGAGIGGLTASALLVHAGKGVLLVGGDERSGGYARARRYGPYVFDRADHLITSCEPEGPFGQGVIDAVLREQRSVGWA